MAETSKSKTELFNELSALRAAQAALAQQLEERSARLERVSDALQAYIAERAHNDEQLRFQAQLLKNVREALIATDLDGYIIYWSEGAEALYGYSAPEVMGQQITRIVGPGQDETECIRLARETGAWSGQHLRLRKDGTTLWVDTAISLITDQQEQPVGLIGIDRDTTARLRVEKELQQYRDCLEAMVAERTAELVAANERLQREIAERQQTEEDLGLFKTIVETSHEAIVVSDRDGNLLYMNPAHERLFKRTLAEARTPGYHDYYEPESTEALIGVIASALAHADSWEGELDVIDASGQHSPVWGRVDTIRDAAGNLRYAIGMMHDITGWKQTLTALRESERKFRGIVEQSSDGICLVDATGIIIEWNKALEDITGLARESALGRLSWDVQLELAPQELRTPALRESIKVQTLELLRTGAAPLPEPLAENRIQRPDGTIRYTQTTVFPIHTDKGIMTAGILRDVTERSAAEEALRQSQERYALAASAGRVGVWDWYLDTGKVTVDPTLKAILGYEDHEIPNDIQALAMLTHPDDFAAVLTATQDHVVGGKPQYELEHRMVHKDGSVRWFLVRGVAMHDETGRPYRIMGANTDITERKQTEEALRQSQERYTLAVNAGRAGVWDWDLMTGHLHLDPILKTVLGYEDHEIPDTIDHWASYIHPDDVAMASVATQDYLAGQTPQYECEHRMIHKDGSVRWFVSRGVVLRDAHGAPYRMTGTDTDITARKLAEAEREKLIEELDAFAHTVAHDLRNPLTVISGFTDLLLEYHDDMPREDIKRNLREIEKYSEKMGNIINELLLLSSVRTEQTVVIEPLDMSAVVAEVQRRLAYLIEADSAEITLPDAWPPAKGYAPWVEEVWANYFSNALQYGGSPPRVWLGADVQANGMVRFWLRDNGPGIAPDDQARLFKPFTRLSQVRSEGHGLGLSIVARIVERLGGQVGVQSAVGKGSTFSFTLPGVNQP